VISNLGRGLGIRIKGCICLGSRFLPSADAKSIVEVAPEPGLEILTGGVQ